MIEGRKISRPIKWMVIFVILLYFVSIAAAYDGLEWENGISGTLKQDGVISFMGYSVKVVAFSAPVESDKYKEIPIEPVEPFVGLNISNNGSFINSTFLGEGDSFISDDGEFKVEVEKLPSGLSKDWLYESYNPWVILKLSQRGKPQLTTTINADDEYVSGQNTEIIAEIILKNTGTAAINNVDLDLGTELPLLRGNLKYHYDTLKKGEEISETVTFSTPVVTDLKKFNIFVNSSGFDVKDISYKTTQLKTILIAPSSQQAPSLSKSTNAKAYLKDLIMVTISFKNNAIYELKNVSIVDSVPKGFKQLSNNSLNWTVNVPPNGEWNFRYLLKPTEANSKGVLFPSTTAELKINNEYYMIQSNRPETIIYGPRIDLSKQADVSEINPGDTVTVTVIAVNSGSTPSMVTIKDDLPADVTLISGNTTREEYLEANKDIRFSYTIKSNSDGPIRLPPATAEFFELGSKGTKLTTMSQELLISIRPPPTPTPTPEPTAVEIPVNHTGPGNVSGNPGSAVNITKPNERPVIAGSGNETSSIEGNDILNFLLGCNEINDNDLRTNMTSDVCSSVLAGDPSMDASSDEKTSVTNTLIGTNLVSNPGFESGSNTPLNWTFVTNNGNTPIWDSEAHRGSKSVKISIPGTINVVSGFPKSDLITAQAKTMYTLSAWGKTRGAGGENAPVVRVTELDANQQWLRQTNLPDFGRGTNDWTQKTVDFKTGPDTSYLYVYANIWNGTGTFWVDDVELKEKTPGIS